MRILFFTDSHIRGSNPKNRLDDFVHTLENKLQEIVSIIEEEEIDYVIHGGDLFDRPDTSVSIVSRFSNILKLIKVPVYIVSGNHDIFGHNPNTINRSMLGLLNSLDFLQILDGNKITLLKDKVKVQLTGQPYTYDIDDSINRNNYMLKNVDPSYDYSIHVVHGMLLDRSFIKGIPFTLVDDIKETEADITLTGHYHAGFKTIIHDDKYFINPGSIVRITNSIAEINRIPRVAIINLNEGIQIKYRELKSAQKGELVLDRSEIERSAFKSERLFEFRQTIDYLMDFEKLDINDVLIEVSNTEGISDEVIKEALNRIARIQMKEFAGD